MEIWGVLSSLTVLPNCLKIKRVVSDFNIFPFEILLFYTMQPIIILFLHWISPFLPLSICSLVQVTITQHSVLDLNNLLYKYLGGKLLRKWQITQCREFTMFCYLAELEICFFQVSLSNEKGYTSDTVLQVTPISRNRVLN